MAIGRPPKATVLHVLEGTTRAHQKAKREDEPDPDGDLNQAPSILTKPQREIWDYAIASSPSGLLRQLDRDMLINWTIAIDELYQAERALQKTGPVILKRARKSSVYSEVSKKTITIETPEYEAISPWVSVRQRAFMRMMKAVSELGFSPTSRTRISIKASGTANKKKNSFAANAAARKRA